MDKERLQNLIERFKENRQYILNEETAKLSLVVPFVKALGYEPNNPREVRLEYAAEFTQGDGKRHPDRMDFAIFDQTGSKPVLVIETKPLGTRLQNNCQQLARYISQMSDLHFGIITDGCNYLFFGDLDAPNQMDREPFFRFSLDDENLDIEKTAKFLDKFSRETFNAQTLVTDAEDSRYRHRMIEKLLAVLRDPTTDEAFMKWLTEDVYEGKRTTSVMERLGRVAQEAVEPTILRLISQEFLDRLKEKLYRIVEAAEPERESETVAAEIEETIEQSTRRRRTVATTDEEVEFYEAVKGICSEDGIPVDDILCKDTVNYFNISYRRPTKWFLRFFADSRKKNLVTPLPVETAKALATGFDVEEAPTVFGTSRIYFDSVGQIGDLKLVVVESLKFVQAEESRQEDTAS